MKKRFLLFATFGFGMVGCRSEVKVVSVPTPTARPTVRPTVTPIPTPTMTPRQKSRARAEKLRQERAERREQDATRRRIAELDAQIATNAKQEKQQEENRVRQTAVFDGLVTAEEYERIQPGMSLSAVMDIIGPGKEISVTRIGSDTARVWGWQNKDGSNMTGIFENGDLVSKAQFGIL